MAHYSGVYSAPRAVILGRELEAQIRAFELPSWATAAICAMGGIIGWRVGYPPDG